MEKFNIIKGIGIAYDGCHKMYILEDEDDIKNMDSKGWNEKDMFPMSELEKLWDKSCSLRFINNWKLDKTFVDQFEDVEILPKGNEYEIIRMEKNEESEVR